MNVNISQLKARLSEYLRAVRGGETVVVLDRLTPIARIEPVSERSSGLSVTPATRPLSDLAKVRGVRTRRPVDVLGILRETRGER